ncbi:cupin [Lysobacteraceae bacterium NML08-0793]|nr:cupin [Xanthomonadaceae bacterium NML08-0793]
MKLDPGSTPMQTPLNLNTELEKLHEYWKPQVFSQGDFGFRLVKFAGDFEWHRHAGSDKIILVVSGDMGVRFDDGRPEVRIRAGELFVLPKGVRHQPHAERECSIVLIERAGLGD